MAFSLGSGDFLVEVDHDDQLINTCLENLLVGYNYNRDKKFIDEMVEISGNIENIWYKKINQFEKITIYKRKNN